MYKKKFAERKEKMAIQTRLRAGSAPAAPVESEPEEPKDALLCDLDHDPDKRPRWGISGRMFSLLRHGEHWSCAHKRCLLKEEIVSLQGIPMLPEHGTMYRPPWEQFMDRCDSRMACRLAGNGMHMHVVVLIECWALACVDFA